MARSWGQIPRPPEQGSFHSVAVWHPEMSHRVEDPGRKLYLNSLAVEGPTSHTSTDDRLVSEDGILHQAARAVAGAEGGRLCGG